MQNEWLGIGRGYFFGYMIALFTAILCGIAMIVYPENTKVLLDYWKDFCVFFVPIVLGIKSTEKIGKSFSERNKSQPLSG